MAASEPNDRPEGAAVWRLADRAAYYATHRDDARNDDDRAHWHTAAHYYADAAADAAAAGLCDIAGAIDRANVSDRYALVSAPTVAHYRAAIVAAVDDNR